MAATLSVLGAPGGRATTLMLHTQAIENAIKVMHAHLHERLTLADLASAAYLSPYHFNRVFHQVVGVPPGEYLAGLRLQMARRLLLTTSLSVTDICFEVGYTSPGSFTTRFTQLVGLPPRLLRRRALEFSLSPEEHAAQCALSPSHSPQAQERPAAHGYICAPPGFQGMICVGLFTRPIPQGAPVKCARLNASGFYALTGLPDGVYFPLVAAFPVAADLQAYFLPGEHLLVGTGASPLLVRRGRISGNPDIVLRAPRLTDPPLVMALPL